jgi:AmmeMemoRadiSam system protein B/AmmeMemoRadiSam system protein A
MYRYLAALIIFLTLICGCTNYMDIDEGYPHDGEKSYKRVRQAAVAGQFYPGRSEELKLKVNQLLDFVSSREKAADINVKAIIVPHAGYEYSGQVAASAFDLLKGRKIKTAVIICNSHSDYFPGIAVDESDAWKTPLGSVEVDFELAEKIVNNSEIIQFNREVHTSDHTLEVQLPFLQTVIEGSFKIVPIVFGNAENGAYAHLSEALSKYLTPDDLLVISTDLSHYPESEIAREIDEKTLELIKAGDIGELEKHIKKTMERRLQNEQTLCCGIDGVKTLMSLAKEKNWEQAEILQYMNSGDLPGGDKSRVVGYGALVFGNQGKSEKLKVESNITEDLKLLNKDQKKQLLNIAKETVENFVKHRQVSEFDVKDEKLLEKEGAFVTLRFNGQLRGCIGQIAPSAKPLYEVVRDMAVSACSEDYRFKPVSQDELEEIVYEVSVLSAPAKINDWKNIELGRHGVIIKKGSNSGVFLPQVADETGWSLEKFLSELCSQKAGLAADCYRDKDTEILVFRAQVFSEDDNIE